MTPDQETDLLSFLALARQGKHPAASGGEHACYALARLSVQVSALMQDIDASNQEAFLLLLRGLAWPDSRESLLKLLPKT